MDGTAQYEGEADFGSLFSTASGPSDEEEWMPLHGFQGVVHFLVGNWASFRSAVRRFISLPETGSGDDSRVADEPYTLVHYDPATASIVELEDDLSLGEDCVGIDYIASHLDMDLKDRTADSGNNNDTINEPANDSNNGNTNNKPVKSNKPTRASALDRGAFFVRVRHEKTPAQWAPTSSQLQADVARIVHAPDDRAPPSRAYLSFPKTSGGPDGQHTGSWDAAQSTAAVRTAVDVLVGQRGHDVFRLCPDEAGTSVSYGLATMRPADVHSLHSVERARQQGGPPRDVYLEHRHLADDQIALVLPGFYPPTTDWLTVVTLSDLESRQVPLAADGAEATTSQPMLPAAAAHIRLMVARFLDAINDDAESYQDIAAELRHVRLLIGGPGDGSGPRQQKQLLLPLRDNLGSIDQKTTDALAALAEARPRCILIYPAYRRRDTRILPGWVDSADHVAMDADDAASVALPALGSSVQEFRRHVAELCRLVPPGGEEPAYDPRVHHVSINPLLPTPSCEEEAEEWNPPFESLTFFLGPDATDDDWFRVRAQIPTRKAVVRVWPPLKSLDWRKSVARSNVWGPRYGRVASASQAQHDRDSNAQQQTPRPVEGRCSGCGFGETSNERALDVQPRERDVVRQCLWCDEPLGELRDDERDEHLLRKHSHQLRALLGRQHVDQRHGGVGSGSTAASTPLVAVDPPASVRQPLAPVGSRSRAPPADEDEETDKENHPGALPDAGASFSSSSTVELGALAYADRQSELRAIGRRFLSRLLSVPTAEESSVDADFQVYEDLEEDGHGDNRPRSRSLPTTALQPAAEIRPWSGQREEMKQGPEPKKLEQEMVQTSGACGRKRQRLEDGVEADAVTEDPVANKRRKTAQPSKRAKAAKKAKPARAVEAAKTKRATRTAQTSGDARTTKSVPDPTSEPAEAPKPGKTAKAKAAPGPRASAGPKKRKTPGPSATLPDGAPAPKRTKTATAPAAPVRRSARLRAKAKGN